MVDMPTSEHPAPFNPCFGLHAGAVVGIVGGNGAGKSTLFRMIMGQENPDAGGLELGETVVPMYVDQSRDALDPNKTVSTSACNKHNYRFQSILCRVG